MNYYYHHIGDFKKDTNYLTHQQRSIYLEMLWMYYDQEHGLEKDLQVLAMKVQSDMDTVKLLLSLYFDEEEECYTHKRIEEELQRTYAKSEAARKSAEARWNKGSMRTQSKRKANGMLPNTQDPKPKTQVSKQKKDYLTDKNFNIFWDAYNYKVGIVKAYESWTKNKCAKDLDKILGHIKHYNESKDVKDGYKKHPSTYLNQQLYLDPITKPNVRYDWEGAK